ncbi:aminotransferase-like domain-containing protein [Actinomadura madurae]|uniref:aminotransferase-like domain-containing protein n=1 Tax=Actinomadura madurae TaxID=1993 RepID=UPI0020D22439|nr:PLP-dependent aminotransferase family protein [Actinomadura madurae]MCQ0015059.1 PLP-dependent aminotransferase family protein [Actinomadura madurae]
MLGAAGGDPHGPERGARLRRPARRRGAAGRPRRHLRRVRAALAEPEDIVVCSGFAQGLALVLHVLARRGVRRVAFEDPGYGDGATMAAAERAGIEAVPVPVDGLGLDVDALAATGARAVVVTPAHQWPTGVVLAPERRRALADWAADRNALVVEDDYDAEFRYDREPVGSVQGLAPGHVIGIGTVSKSLAPAVRLGWILCPPALTRAVAEEKRLADRGSPVLDQLALAALIESGRYGRHLRHMRPLYAARRAALVDALARHAPGVRLSGLDAGFHAVAHLPRGEGRAARRRRGAQAVDRPVRDEHLPDVRRGRPAAARPRFRRPHRDRDPRRDPGGGRPPRLLS